MPEPTQKRILSGVQPSGKLHLGNYFGAIQQHIALQDRGEAFYFIADYHALTTLKEAEAREADAALKAGRSEWMTAPCILADNVRDVALDYLALGLDPNKATFYRQSDIPEVTELAWILSTVTGMGLLERATSYKDKVDQGITPTVGLFTYPVLMAADILIVRSHLVPVGKDQVQHLEMTRDMAGYFNRAYAEVFPEPRELLGEAAVVPGTDGRKMSKSYGNAIGLTEPAPSMYGKLMSIPDAAMPQWFELLTRVPEAELARVLAGHPRAAKARLAHEITSFFHGGDAARAAGAAFDRQFRDKGVPDEVPEVAWNSGWDAAGVPLAVLLRELGLAASSSDARRKVQQGGVRLDGEVAQDPMALVPRPAASLLIQSGKRDWRRLRG